MAKRKSRMITVWVYEDAPKIYRDALDDKSDADWLAFVPDGLEERYIGWLQCEHFGCCNTESKKIRGGTVYVGYHS